MGAYCIQEIVSWYQKKIGTYDKQQWEKTVEQRILSGFTHVPKKTAKLKTELIDVDLVRGSSFTKAKPKHGLATVSRLALLRLVFLPFYARWWSQQTSAKLFALLLTLYVFQIANMFLYSYCTHHLPEDAMENVSASEVIVPAAMMLFLCILHSEIVSPNSNQKEMAKYANKFNSKRFKRIKRRNRNVQCFDCKSSPDTGSENKTGIANDVCMKFTKRHHRGRKLSFEDGMMKANGSNGSVSVTCRHRRNVVWDTSPVKARMMSTVSPNEQILANEQQQSLLSGENSKEEQSKLIGDNGDIPSLASPAHTPGILDDDGFESLNSNGSSDQSEVIPLAEEDDDDHEAGGGKVPVCCRDIGVSKEKKWSFYTAKRISPKTDKLLKNLRGGVISSHLSSGETDHDDSDTDKSDKVVVTHHSQSPNGQRLLNRRRGSQQTLSVNVSVASGGECSNLSPLTMGGDSSYNSTDYEDEDEVEGPGGGSSGGGSSAGGPAPSTTETAGGGTTSAAEWIGITTNSDDCSVSSEIDDIPSSYPEFNDHPFASEFQLLSPSVIHSPSCAASDKVSCTMWEKREVKKAELSVLDISSAIIARVEAMPENLDYFYGGMLVSILLGMVPSLYRLTEVTSGSGGAVGASSGGASVNGINAAPADVLFPPYAIFSLHNILSIYNLAFTFVSSYATSFLDSAFGTNVWERCIAVIALVERTILSGLFFFLIAVAERTFKQRFLYAKFFSHLTSFRRARKSELPHFRLNKVRNIKTWLSVRSYLKKRGPQHSVDVIVSSVFLITLLLLSFLSVELLKDSERLHSMYNIEALVWCIILGLFLLRFMTLGTKVNRKYRNLSVLITEQINLYLQIEQKPNKKEELMVANSVLKLAADLLKELECPYKISGLSANPYLYTITKVVILSALSGVLSEMLGFKLKLHKIKIK